MKSSQYATHGHFLQGAVLPLVSNPMLPPMLAAPRAPAVALWAPSGGTWGRNHSPAWGIFTTYTYIYIHMSTYGKHIYIYNYIYLYM